MSLVISWETETRRSIRQVVEPVGLDIVSLVSRGESDYELLRFLDPYGDTTFNRVQMRSFQKDWAKLRSELEERGFAEFWMAINELADLCSREVHTYIRFVGD